MWPAAGPPVLGQVHLFRFVLLVSEWGWFLLWQISRQGSQNTGA